MKKKIYITWAALFVLCAALSFVSQPAQWLQAVMFLAAAAFFACPGWLVWKGSASDRRVVRNLSFCSLALTLFALVLNFLLATGSTLAGDVAWAILVVVSVPMVCSRVWALSMFCWAFLMLFARKLLKKQ